MKEGIKPLSKVLDAKGYIAFAYLFGSKVKGYANERSDWDIAVYFSESLDKIGRWAVFELEAELSRVVASNVQVVVLNRPLPPVFGFQIISGGILIIDRDKNLRMDFENRVLRRYYDWQYFLKRQMESEGRLSPLLTGGRGG